MTGSAWRHTPLYVNSPDRTSPHPLRRQLPRLHRAALTAGRIFDSSLFSPAGWLRFKNKCFLFKGKKNDIKGNWSYARDWCKEQGGDLAIIDDQYENGKISRYLEHSAWIGLSDLLAENQYAWSDGVSPVLYTHWDTNEPNNVGGTEHCVTMKHNMLMSGKWNDDACHKNHSFVCYRKKCQ
uniref:C-type lectin domain-containing protein n=1 Tax=Oryzias sinensis TaxID=183150 RepID=A0A8C7XN08_9TELE